MKLSTRSIIILVAILALLASASVVFAQKDVPVRHRRGGARGEVTAVGPSSLTLSTAKGKSVTVKVSDETQIHLRRRQSEGSLCDIQVGYFARVRGWVNEDGTIEARLILAKSKNSRIRKIRPR